MSVLRRLFLLTPAVVPSLWLATPAAAQNGRLGQAIAIGDGEILVSEPANTFRAGRVYVYRPTADGWREAAILEAPDAGRADGFGSTLALAGSTLFVGQDERIHVFEKDGSGTWHATRTLPPTASGQRYGAAIAASGDWLLVGAPATPGGGRGGRGGRGRGGQQPVPPGVVHAFHRGADGSWSPQGTIRPSASADGDAFGEAIAIDGGRVLVGAPGAGEGAGAVYAFRLDASGQSWRESETLVPPESGASDRFGQAIALSGGSAAIGSPGRGEGAGGVDVFREDGSGGAWRVVATMDPGPGGRRDGFGSAVALSGNEIWVGASNPPGNLTGRVVVLRAAGDAYTPVRAFVAPEADARDAFGGGLAIRGDIAVATATGMDHGAGAAFVYSRTPAGDWREAGVLLSPPDNLRALNGAERRCSAEGKVEDLFDCGDVELLALVTPSTLSMPGEGRGVRLNDIWGWTDPETGKEYALVGRTDGTSFVDITDPVNPVLVGDLPQTPGSPPSPIWRDIKTYRNHAFIVADAAGEHGMQVFDLTQLRRVRNGPVTFTPTNVYRRMNSAHNVVINEETGFAYIVGASAGGETCGGGLHMVDIRDPRNPTFAGCFTHADPDRGGRGYTHDAQCVLYHGPDQRYAGHEICLGSNERSLSIADVTDKANPEPLSRISYPNPSYTHQGWFTEDQRYYFVDDESDEIAGSVDRTRTLVYDLTDLEDPRLHLEWLGTTSASDHNLYIRGNLMYQSNYRAGLRIIDISDPDAPTEVGHFDTAPYLEDGPGFSGTWSNYPFFPSGVIIVSSVQEGMFIVKKRDRPVS